MNKKEQTIFLQKFSKLLEATLPLEDALRIAAKNIKNRKFAKKIMEMEEGVMSGRSLQDIFTTQIGVWGQATAALVTVGELSSTLAANLLRASENIKSQTERQGKMLAALFYPAIISFLACGIIIFLLAFVYPKITPLFSGVKAELPLSTRVVIKGSSLISDYWLWVLAALAGISGIFYYAMIESIPVRIFMEKLVISLPVVGNLVLLNLLCETSFIIGSLCQGGMSISNALEVAENSIGFLIIREHFKEVRVEISSGASLSDSIGRRKIFPDVWVDLLSVGERTGSLSSILLNISELHRQEIDEKMTLINKLIEPLMMILVGGVVGFIALSIITPMYSLTQHVHEK